MRIRYYSFVLAAAAVTALCGCGSSKRPNIDAIPAQDVADDAWGMIGADGKMIFSNEFDNCPSAAINGIFSVRENEGISVYALEEHPKVVGDLEGLDQAGFYSEGLLLIVRPDSRIEAVNGKGKSQFTLEKHNGHEITMCYPAYFDGLLVAHFDNDKWGAFDTSGNVVIEPEWDGMSLFAEGYALALRIKDDKNHFYIIDRKGEKKTTLPEGFSPRINIVKDGKVGGSIERNGTYRMAIADLDGNINLLPSKAKNILDFGKDFVIFGDADGEEGLMTPEGDVCIRSKYSKIVRIGDKFFGSRGDKLYLLTLQGEETLIGTDLVPVINSSILQNLFSSKFALMETGDEYRLVNDDGEPLGRKYFATISLHLDDDFLHSRFIDYEGITADIAALIGDKGFGNSTLGSNINDYYSPGDAVSNHAFATSQSFYPDVDVRDCTVEVTVRSAERAGLDVTPNSYFYTWERNPDALVNEVLVYIRFPYSSNSSEASGKCSNAVETALREAGYKADGSVFTKGGTECVVDSSTNDAVTLLFTVRRDSAAAMEPVVVEAEEVPDVSTTPAAEGK